MDRSTKATLAGLAGNSIFGFSFLFSKLALGVTTPFVLLSVRFVIAFLVMNLLVLTGRVKLELKGKPIKMVLLLGLLQPILYFIFETYGIAMTSSSFSGIMLGLVPVVGLVVGRVMLKESATLRQVVCAFGSIFGVVLTSLGGGLGAFSPLGTLLLAGAAVSAALFNAVSRSTSKNFSAVERTYVMFALGAVVFPIIAILQNLGDLSVFAAAFTSGRFWGAVIYLAVISSVAAFLLVNYAMGGISVAKASVFTNFATVISVLAGIFIMGDSFTVPQLIGIVVIIVSVLGVSYQKSEEKEAVGS